jgi:hypothetical protein
MGDRGQYLMKGSSLQTQQQLYLLSERLQRFVRCCVSRCQQTLATREQEAKLLALQAYLG